MSTETPSTGRLPTGTVRSYPMATEEETPSFDDLASISPSNDNDDDEPTVKLDAGEEYVARLRHIERGVGKYNNDVLHITLENECDGHEPGSHVKWWSNDTVSGLLDDANVQPGDVIGVRKDEDPYSYIIEDDDGNEEEREAYGFEVGVLEGGN